MISPEAVSMGNYKGGLDIVQSLGKRTRTLLQTKLPGAWNLVTDLVLGPKTPARPHNCFQSQTCRLSNDATACDEWRVHDHEGLNLSLLLGT